MNTLARISTALLIGASFSSAAMAATPLTSTVSAAGGTAAKTSTLSSSATKSNTTKATSGTVSATGITLDQFDTTTGILVGAKVGVSGVTTADSAQVHGVLGENGAGRTLSATASLAGAVSGTGFTSITNAVTDATRSCSGGSCPSSATTAATTVAGPTLAGTAAVDAGSLASYAGTGTVTLGRSATGSSSITTGANARSGTARAYYSFTGGTYSIAYDYLNFASPSFSGDSVVTSLALDFGTVGLNSGPVTLNFTLFNIGDVNSAGVSLSGVTSDFSNTQFSSSASSFTNLAGGNSLTYSVTFDASLVGLQHDVLRLALADYAPGGVGGTTYALDIGVTGLTKVLAANTAVADVPEPATWATMIAGLGLVGVSARRRRGRGAVAA